MRRDFLADFRLPIRRRILRRKSRRTDADGRYQASSEQAFFDCAFPEQRRPRANLQRPFGPCPT